ncbi:MAG TPA: tyrosine-type recombinase/integrase [Bacteroidales bacterium]|nr:tyrosine-type recombinase/integrase [Bacteroidales bacterium]
MVFAKAGAIIEKWKGYKKGRLLPYLSNQKMNQWLKVIAVKANINTGRSLTTHAARHTFATTVALSNGASMELVQSMLGHKDIRTTAIYGKIVKKRQMSEMIKLKEAVEPSMEPK